MANASTSNSFYLANTDFCTGNRADGKSAVSVKTGGFIVGFGTPPHTLKVSKAWCDKSHAMICKKRNKALDTK